jgi:DNA-binding NtrC family response regulator
MRANILVIDDDLHNLELLAEILTDAGYRVRTARDGVEALAAIARELPDAVVADIRMPRLGGSDLAAALRAQGVRIPTVLVSATAPPPGDGAIPFVAKPFDLDHLLAIVERALQAD